MQISIDNSALNNILNDGQKSLQLEKLIVEKDLVLIIPFETFSEALGGDDIDQIHLRLGRLHGILEKVGVRRLIISRSAADWIRREIESRGRIKNIPWLANSPRWHGIRKILSDKNELREFHNKSEGERLRQKAIKENLRKSDKVFREMATSVFSKEEIRSKILNFDSRTKATEVLFFISAFRFVASGTKIRSALRKSDGFVHLKCYLNLMLLRGLGNALTEFSEDDPLKFFEGIKLGNWFDLGCIAISSQLDRIVTDDEDQRSFSKLANELGILKASPLCSGGLLAL